MPRPNQIHAPVKVTLYLPKDTVVRGKAYASRNHTSLSKVTTEVLEERMSGNVKHVIHVSPTTQDLLESVSKDRKLSISEIIPAILNDHFRH